MPESKQGGVDTRDGVPELADDFKNASPGLGMRKLEVAEAEPLKRTAAERRAGARRRLVVGQFLAAAPSRWWATDFNQIWTAECWLSMAMALVPNSCRVVGRCGRAGCLSTHKNGRRYWPPSCLHFACLRPPCSVSDTSFDVSALPDHSLLDLENTSKAKDESAHLALGDSLVGLHRFAGPTPGFGATTSHSKDTISASSFSSTMRSNATVTGSLNRRGPALPGLT